MPAYLRSNCLPSAAARCCSRRLVNVNNLVTNMEAMLGRIIGEQITIETALDPELGLDQGWTRTNWSRSS